MNKLSRIAIAASSLGFFATVITTSSLRGQLGWWESITKLFNPIQQTESIVPTTLYQGPPSMRTQKGDLPTTMGARPPNSGEVGNIPMQSAPNTAPPTGGPVLPSGIGGGAGVSGVQGTGNGGGNVGKYPAHLDVSCVGAHFPTTDAKGKFVAFNTEFNTKNLLDTNSYGVYVKNLSDSSLRKISDLYNVHGLEFSGDRKYVFIDAGGARNIQRIDLSNGETIDIKTSRLDFLPHEVNVHLGALSSDYYGRMLMFGAPARNPENTVAVYDIALRRGFVATPGTFSHESEPAEAFFHFGATFDNPKGGNPIVRRHNGTYEFYFGEQTPESTPPVINTNGNYLEFKDYEPVQGGEQRWELIRPGSSNISLIGYAPELSTDGETLIFTTKKARVAADTNTVSDVYAMRVATGQEQLVSVGPGGVGTCRLQNQCGDGFCDQAEKLPSEDNAYQKFACPMGKQCPVLPRNTSTRCDKDCGPGAVRNQKAICGNRIKEPGEECDMGFQNVDPNTGCSTQCKLVLSSCDQCDNKWTGGCGGDCEMRVATSDYVNGYSWPAQYCAPKQHCPNFATWKPPAPPIPPSVCRDGMKYMTMLEYWKNSSHFSDSKNDGTHAYFLRANVFSERMGQELITIRMSDFKEVERKEIPVQQQGVFPENATRNKAVAIDVENGWRYEASSPGIVIRYNLSDGKATTILDKPIPFEYAGGVSQLILDKVRNRLYILGNNIDANAVIVSIDLTSKTIRGFLGLPLRGRSLVSTATFNTKTGDLFVATQPYSSPDNTQVPTSIVKVALRDLSCN